MPSIDIRISGSTMATHVDAQNAILTALSAQCPQAYTLGTPKGSWHGEVRVVHLVTDETDVVTAVVASVDPLGCTVEVNGPAAGVPSSEPAATSTRRGGRRKSG